MKILLVDEHTLFREGMRHVLSLLADEVTIVEAGNCIQALQAIETNSGITLVLLDLDMPGPGGFDVLGTLSRDYPALPIVVLSASENPADIRRALENGARGFIPKSETIPVMVGALHLVLAGGVYVPPAIIRAGASSASPPILTPRQIDILKRVIEGKPNKIIANDLGVTEATVKAHVTAVFKVLRVSNRNQVAHAVARIGMKFTDS